MTADTHRRKENLYPYASGVGASGPPYIKKIELGKKAKKIKRTS